LLKNFFLTDFIQKYLAREKYLATKKSVDISRLFGG